MPFKCSVRCASKKGSVFLHLMGPSASVACLPHRIFVLIERCLVNVMVQENASCLDCLFCCTQNH